MHPSAKDLYDGTVRRLPPTEQLRLASLILSGLAERDLVPIDESDAWSEQDVREVAEFAARYASSAYREEEDND